MSNEEIGQHSPLFATKEGFQILLHLIRIAAVGKPDTMGKASDVGIHRDALVLSKGVIKHDICCFSSHAWKRQQVLHAGWYLSIIPFYECPGGSDNVPRLHPKKSQGMDDLFDIFRYGDCQGIGSGIPFEQRLAYLIYRPIGGLCRENGQNEYLKRGPPSRRGLRSQAVAIRLDQDLVYLLRPGRGHAMG